MDLWHWRAELTDGTAVAEYDDAGRHWWRHELDLAHVARLILLPQMSGLPAHSLVAKPGERLLFFRRRTMRANIVTGALSPVSTIHCMGVERYTRGRIETRYRFLFADGRVVVSSDRDAV